MDKCPGQDNIIKGPEDIEFTCFKCGKIVEIWPPSLRVECPGCGAWVYREMQDCADWCPMARECLGEEKYKEWQESKKHEGG
ncbi:MAG: hypothetical protein AAB577_02045 [Patescibacteria group bacterium]